MSLAELETKMIRPLSRLEKLQLIADITKMLQEEYEGPENYFDKMGTYPVMTPTVSPDDRSYETAYKLQLMIDQHNIT